MMWLYLLINNYMKITKCPGIYPWSIYEDLFGTFTDIFFISDSEFSISEKLKKQNLKWHMDIVMNCAEYAVISKMFLLIDCQEIQLLILSILSVLLFLAILLIKDLL